MCPFSERVGSHAATPVPSADAQLGALSPRTAATAYACGWNRPGSRLVIAVGGFTASADRQPSAGSQCRSFGHAKQRQRRRPSICTRCIGGSKLQQGCTRATSLNCLIADSHKRRFKAVATQPCRWLAGGKSSGSAPPAPSTGSLVYLAFTWQPARRAQTEIGRLPVHLGCLFRVLRPMDRFGPTAYGPIIPEKPGSTDGYRAQADPTGPAAACIATWPVLCQAPHLTTQSGSSKGKLRRICQRNGCAPRYSASLESLSGLARWQILPRYCQPAVAWWWRSIRTGGKIVSYMKRCGAWLRPAGRSVTGSR